MIRKKNDVATNIFVSLLAYFACMKNRITSVALSTAIDRAMAKLNGWTLMNATATVTAVSTIRLPKMPKYIDLGATCDIASEPLVSQWCDRPVDQIQQREQEDPYDVDEVPVEAGHLHRRVPRGREAALVGHPGNDAQQEEADHHVRGVE